MNGDELQFDRMLEALRAESAPAARAGLRVDSLAAFERERGGAAHRSRRVGFGPRAVAAAAVLAAAVLGLVVGGERSARRLPAGVPIAALLDRTDALERRLAEFEARQNAFAAHEPPPVAPGSVAELVQPAYDASGRDPGLLRLVAASRVEVIDVAAARQRYREVTEQFAASPAAVIARQRLARLGD